MLLHWSEGRARTKWIHIPVLQVLVPPRSTHTQTILVHRISPEGHVSAVFVTVEQLRRQRDETSGFGAGEAAMNTARRDENERRFLEVAVERQGDEDSAVAHVTGDHLIAQMYSLSSSHTHILIE